MALPTRAISGSNFGMKGQSRQLEIQSMRDTSIVPTSAFKLPTTAELRDPSTMKLWEVIARPIKEFPWKEALKVAYGGQIIVYHMLKAMSAFSKSDDFLIPFRVILGWILVIFLKEISQVMEPSLENLSK